MLISNTPAVVLFTEVQLNRRDTRLLIYAVGRDGEPSKENHMKHILEVPHQFDAYNEFSRVAMRGGDKKIGNWKKFVKLCRTCDNKRPEGPQIFTGWLHD